MAQEYVSSVRGAVIRASALSASGAPATGANASYVMSAFTHVTFTPEYEAGDDITVKNADGGICVSYKGDDILKRVNIELAICLPDPELTALISGGTILTAPESSTTTAASATSGASTLSLTASVGAGIYTLDTGGTQETITIASVSGTSTPFIASLAAPLVNSHNSGVTVAGSTLSIGYAAPFTGVDSNPNGNGLEVWSRAIGANGTQNVTHPYFRWVFPYVQLKPTGDRVIDTGAMASTFTGWGVGNALFSPGPNKDWAYISDRPFQYALDAYAPVGLRGYQTVT